MTMPDKRLRDALAEIGRLPTYSPPPDVWNRIEQELDRASSPRLEPVRSRTPWWSHRVAAAVAFVALGALASSLALGVHHSSWSIEQIAGAPVAGTRTIVRGGTLAEGEWLETDAASRARLSIGTLGTADVGPSSRVRLVQAGGVARALRVERGSIDARVWAPPRFFLVETPAATAVDLGCIYSLDVDDQGNGLLRVRSGQVELRGHGRGSLVVAGTVAKMRRGAGPGTPYASNEPQAFVDALEVVDFGGGDRVAAIDQLLATATVRSSITLWHLLPRVTRDERPLVYDRLTAIAAPPEGVDREAVLLLDDRALSRWRAALEPAWSSERVRLWKRAWRAVWSVARGE